MLVKITDEADKAISVLIREMRKFGNDESRARVFQILDAFFCKSCGHEFTDVQPTCYCENDE